MRMKSTVRGRKMVRWKSDAIEKGKKKARGRKNLKGRLRRQARILP